MRSVLSASPRPIDRFAEDGSPDQQIEQCKPAAYLQKILFLLLIDHFDEFKIH
jgi:hypothetical protein